MFERFSKEAKAAVVGAQQVARDAGSRSVDTRHLVVVLAKTAPVIHSLQEVGADVDAVVAMALADLRAGGLDGDALAGIGIDLDAVRRQADEVFGADALQRAVQAPKGHIPFTRDAKKALELSLREAIRLGQKSIQSSHLLLGILRFENAGHALVVKAGVDLVALRVSLEGNSRAA